MSERTLKSWPFTPAPQLVADTGGTNTRVALADAGVLRQGSIRRYANADFPSLAAVLQDYMRHTATTDCAGVCVGVAGPVEGDRAVMTNLDWVITAAELGTVAGTARVKILNDLQAQGHALAALDRRHVRALLPGRPAPQGSVQLVVGAGTGMNAAPVLTLPGGVHVAASECGHIHLPVHGEQEHALARHMAQHDGVAMAEEALCGRGLTMLHAWVGGQTLPPEAVIAALAAGDSAALESGRLYARLMGRVLATLALVHLPYGGIFLIGGMARAMAPHLIGLGMGEAFHQMGRFSDFLQGFPVQVVEDDYAALLGCATYLTALPG